MERFQESFSVKKEIFPIARALALLIVSVHSQVAEAAFDRDGNYNREPVIRTMKLSERSLTLEEEVSCKMDKQRKDIDCSKLEKKKVGGLYLAPKKEEVPEQWNVLEIGAVAALGGVTGIALLLMIVDFIIRPFKKSFIPYKKWSLNITSLLSNKKKKKKKREEDDDVPPKPRRPIRKKTKQPSS